MADIPATCIDDEAMTRRVVRSALSALRQPLLSADLAPRPAAYLLFAEQAADGPTDFDRLVGPYSLGERPLYAGAADDMRGRRARYAGPQSLGGARGLPTDRLWVAPVYARTRAGAVLAEAICMEVFACPWNAPDLAGAGSRQQGRLRRGQRVQPWGRIWPRPWDGMPGPASRAASLLAMAAHAVEPAGPGPWWPPLPPLGRAPQGRRKAATSGRRLSRRPRRMVAPTDRCQPQGPDQGCTRDA